jgi:hypothetical protein
MDKYRNVTMDIIYLSYQKHVILFLALISTSTSCNDRYSEQYDSEHVQVQISTWMEFFSTSHLRLSHGYLAHVNLLNVTMLVDIVLCIISMVNVGRYPNSLCQNQNIASCLPAYILMIDFVAGGTRQYIDFFVNECACKFVHSKILTNGE